MTFDLFRRITSLLGIASLIFGTATCVVGEPQPNRPALERVTALERDLGGRVGVAAIDTGNGQRIGYRQAERFPMCSTFKFLAVAAILQSVDKNEERLSRRISYSSADLLDWAPITKEHVHDGMTLEALCAAAIEYSDNTAGNLLLQPIGGPAKLTEYVRSLGDPVTRLDRVEPSLNSAVDGDDRDTTSPDSMLRDMNVLLLGDRLSEASRQRFEAWLDANVVGAERLRAGFPSSWQVGDKTGSGANGAAGDIAIVRPPNRAPILVAVYLVGSTRSTRDLDFAFAEIGRIIADVL
jgi:beta-lactamase class A